MSAPAFGGTGTRVVVARAYVGLGNVPREPQDNLLFFAWTELERHEYGRAWRRFFSAGRFPGVTGAFFYVLPCNGESVKPLAPEPAVVDPGNFIVDSRAEVRSLPLAVL